MKKAYPIVPFGLLRKLICSYYYQHEEEPGHPKICRKGSNDVIAFRSNRSGAWYVKERYSLFFSQAGLSDIQKRRLQHMQDKKK